MARTGPAINFKPLNPITDMIFNTTDILIQRAETMHGILNNGHSFKYKQNAPAKLPFEIP